MPKYAHFDHTAPTPQPVLGWYDTDALDYPNLPPPADMLPMSEDQWKSRLKGDWAVSGKTIVPYTQTPVIGRPGQTPLEALGAMLAAKQTAGVFFDPSGATPGVLFPTDLVSMTKLTALWSAIQAGLWSDGRPIIAADGTPVPMSSSDAAALVKKALAYVQACDDRYAALHPLVVADPSTDISGGWPSNL